MQGQKFGRLSVIRYAYTDKYRCAVFECKCECGNTVYVRGRSLRSGETKSCGCLQKDIAKEHIEELNAKGGRGQGNLKHGCKHTELYRHWCHMKQRCNNERSDNYKYYGGRGIKVCSTWEKDFVSFKTWAIKNGYKDGLTLERIDVNGNYEPKNCKWIPFIKQIRNRRNTVKLTYKNDTKPLVEWCELFGVNYKLAHARYKKGWLFERIFGL